MLTKAFGLNLDPGGGGMSSHKSHTVCALEQDAFTFIFQCGA